MNMFDSTAAAPVDVPTEHAEEHTAPPVKRQEKRAVSSTAKRVLEAEALLRKRKLQLREELELTALRQVAAERLGRDCSDKNRNAIFDALIADFGLA